MFLANVVELECIIENHCTIGKEIEFITSDIN